MEQRPICLTIGGSDSCGGAGIQADLRVFEDLGVQGCSAITALTAQNPQSIGQIQPSSPAQFAAEISAIASFYDVACIKTGMLYDEEHLSVVVELKQKLLPDALLVIDPVLISSSGKQLFSAENAKAAYTPLIKHASLWTPNLEEAAYFLGHPIDDTVEAASELMLTFRSPVLLKGGHSSSEQCQDLLLDIHGNIESFTHNKQILSLGQSHGTGCRLASATAAYLAKGESLVNAVSKAENWLQEKLTSSFS